MDDRILQKLMAMKDKLPAEMKGMIVINVEEHNWKLPPKLAKVAKIFQSLTDDEKRLVLHSCRKNSDGDKPTTKSEPEPTAE